MKKNKKREFVYVRCECGHQHFSFCMFEWKRREKEREKKNIKRNRALSADWLTIHNATSMKKTEIIILESKERGMNSESKFIACPNEINETRNGIFFGVCEFFKCIGFLMFFGGWWWWWCCGRRCSVMTHWNEFMIFVLVRWCGNFFVGAGLVCRGKWMTDGELKKIFFLLKSINFDGRREIVFGLSHFSCLWFYR